MLSFIKRLFAIEPVGEPTLHPGGPAVTPTPTVPTTVTPPPITVGPVTTPVMPATPTISPDATVMPVNRAVQIGPTIAIVNISSVLTDQQIATFTSAMQIQLDRDFAPAWKTTANLMAIPRGGNVPSGTWILYIMDTSDQAGALGYHDLTSEGNPLGKVFAKDDQKYGLSWTVTASHEIMEMMIDPYIQNTVFSQTSNTAGTLYALEVADACEDDSFGYTINGVLVSDFVYPTWFEDFRAPNSTKFDHMHVITAPLTLAKGGYIGVFPIPNTNGWTQRLADEVPMRLKIREAGGAARAVRRGAAPLSE